MQYKQSSSLQASPFCSFFSNCLSNKQDNKVSTIISNNTRYSSINTKLSNINYSLSKKCISTDKYKKTNALSLSKQKNITKHFKNNSSELPQNIINNTQKTQDTSIIKENIGRTAMVPQKIPINHKQNVKNIINRNQVKHEIYPNSNLQMYYNLPNNRPTQHKTQNNIQIVQGPQIQSRQHHLHINMNEHSLQFARKKTQKTLPSSGRNFNDQNQSSIIHYIQQFQRQKINRGRPLTNTIKFKQSPIVQKSKQNTKSSILIVQQMDLSIKQPLHFPLKNIDQRILYLNEDAKTVNSVQQSNINDPKIEQSSIMIDFFNPNSRIKSKLENDNKLKFSYFKDYIEQGL